MECVAIYARFSSSNQRDESIDAQVRAMEKYAKDRGYTIIKKYIDRAESGTSDKRENFQQMIVDSKLELFNRVLVHKLDRFARNKYDSVTYKRQLKMNGVTVESVTENLDGSPESVILESMLEGMAEYYSANLAREVMKGMTETAHKAQHTGGIPPLGYDVDKETKQYMINETEAEAVRLIFQRYTEGYGYKTIIKELNQLGYKTKKGNEFGSNSLYDIVGNEKYTGTYIFNRTLGKQANGKRNSRKTKNEEEIIKIPGGMPQIISQEIYNKAMMIRKDNKRSRGKFKAKRVYMLTGLIYCGECGKRFVGTSRNSGRSKKLYVTYKCGQKASKKSCIVKEFNRDYLELAVLDSMEKRFFTEKGMALLIDKLTQIKQSDENKSEVKTEELDEKIAAIDVKLEKLVEVLLDGSSLETVKEKIKKLEQEKAELEAEKQYAKHKEDTFKTMDVVKIRQKLEQHGKTVRDRDRKECKKFMKDYIKEIHVSNENVVIKYKLDIAGIDEVIGTHELSKSEIYKNYRSMVMHVDNSLEDAAS
jgi:site-specific DNA recombinase